MKNTQEKQERNVWTHSTRCFNCGAKIGKNDTGCKQCHKSFVS